MRSSSPFRRSRRTPRYSSLAACSGVFKGEAGETIYTGDLLEPYRSHIHNDMFHGFDFDATMLRIASMNMTLHGVDNPDIHYQDTLSNSFPERFASSTKSRPTCAPSFRR